MYYQTAPFETITITFFFFIDIGFLENTLYEMASNCS